MPKWKDSRISFKNVYVSKRPDSPAAPKPWKGAGHMAAVGYDVSNHPAYHRIGEDDDESDVTDLHDEDTNFTMFDLNIDSVDVTLSLKRWLDGKGLVEDAVVRGVRGVVGSYFLSKSTRILTDLFQNVDRQNVFWDPDNPLDPALFRHVAQPGDFD